MSLLSVAQLKEYLPELTGSGSDSELQNIIDRVESNLASWLGFPVYDSGALPSLESQTYTLYIDHPDYLDPDILQLPIKPVTAITSIFADADRVYTADTEITSTEYELDSQLGRIILKTQVATQGFSTGYRANRVICTAGYSNTRSDLLHPIAVYCSHLWRARANQGKKSLAIQGATTSFSPNTIPPEVKELLYHLRSSTQIL